ncbi:MAG: UDP-N-acetylmuramoyl-tripeptide--D-alanyl-D-alanine ligase [Chitinispirillaceae bacterium]|nr:UDP-N-acetylmuramoyl-tripeptide--D-alanyl-D-alanine ligase [Chitinispirillaceae bacterium]
MNMHKSPLTLGDLIEWGAAESALSRRGRGMAVNFVWNDSRKVGAGDVFVALSTDKDDGHRYVATAFSAGAAAVIVEKKAVVECAERDQSKLIVVKNSLRAIQMIAARYRAEQGMLIVGVTGSSGKTTTRSYIASVLKTGFRVGETFSNWNNHIGVPLSLLRFRSDEWIGVVEMGANHEREISVLSKIARPDIGVITNIGYAHLGLFGSLAATTQAKFEIVDGLNKKDGFLLLNGDDARLVAHAKKHRLPAMFFGLSSGCDVRPEKISFDPERGIGFILDNAQFHLPMAGRHFIYSALPAIFLGRRCGIADQQIAEAVAAQKPPAMRGAIESRKNARFIVDCYNANPSSMKSAVALLCEKTGRQHRVAIVGDMLELGKFSKRLHRDLGRLLAESGVRVVVAVGAFAGDVADGAVAAGMSPEKITAVATAEDAIAPAKSLIREGDVVLVKGSRGVHLETVFEKY